MTMAMRALMTTTRINMSSRVDTFEDAANPLVPVSGAQCTTADVHQQLDLA
jgi:hypothetical protein